MKKTILKLWTGNCWSSVFPETYTRFVKRENSPLNLEDTLAKIESDITVLSTGTYIYRGKVDTYESLPVLARNGDVYEVISEYNGYQAGTNWVWNGESWDPMAANLSDKLDRDKSGDNYMLYGTSATATDKMYGIASDDTRVKPGNIAMYRSEYLGKTDTPSATLAVKVPKNPYEAANKKYVDGKLQYPAIASFRDMWAEWIYAHKCLGVYDSEGYVTEIFKSEGIEGDTTVFLPAEDGTLLTEEKAEEKYLEKAEPAAGRYQVYCVGPFNQAMLDLDTKAPNIARYYNATDTLPTVTGVMPTATPTKDIHAANKKYVDDRSQWKLLGETEITQAMIDEAGEEGITALIIDLGAPIESWYGETWIRIEFGTSGDLNASEQGATCNFAKTLNDATQLNDNNCWIMHSQSSAYAKLFHNYKNCINIFTNWFENIPHGSSFQCNAFSAYSYPFTAYATSNNVTISAVGMQYLAFGSSGMRFKFPVGTTLKLYGRF